MPIITTIIDKDTLARFEQNGQDHLLRAITAIFGSFKKYNLSFSKKTAVSIVLRLLFFLVFAYQIFACCYFLWITDDNSMVYGFSNQFWAICCFLAAVCVLMLLVFYKKIFYQKIRLSRFDKYIIKIASQKSHQEITSQMLNPANIKSAPYLRIYELSENTITCRRENDILHWQFHINYPKQSYYYMTDDFCLLFIKRRFMSKMYMTIWVNADNKPILTNYLQNLGVSPAELGD